MPDMPIETTIETIPVPNVIRFGPTASGVIFGLAIYGAADLTNQIVTKTKQIRQDRKLKKVVKQAKEQQPPQ